MKIVLPLVGNTEPTSIMMIVASSWFYFDQLLNPQIWHGTSVPGKWYAVDCFVKMLGVTYGDNLTTVMRFCMRRLSKSSCELR